MTEIELLYEISGKITTISEQLNALSDILQCLQTLIYALGATIGLQLIILFAKAWGRNT